MWDLEKIYGNLNSGMPYFVILGVCLGIIFERPFMRIGAQYSKTVEKNTLFGKMRGVLGNCIKWFEKNA